MDAQGKAGGMLTRGEMSGGVGGTARCDSVTATEGPRPRLTRLTQGSEREGRAKANARDSGKRAVDNGTRGSMACSM